MNGNPRHIFTHTRARTSSRAPPPNGPQAYANSQGVTLIGDMPIYVGGQSADVWAHRGLFALGETGAPEEVSGVPPDAFSDSGQLWGSPLYDWQARRGAGCGGKELGGGRGAGGVEPCHPGIGPVQPLHPLPTPALGRPVQAQEADGYKWWIQRFQRSLQLYDETRVDHFRAFAGYWAVPADHDTGAWDWGPPRARLCGGWKREVWGVQGPRARGLARAVADAGWDAPAQGGAVAASSAKRPPAAPPAAAAMNGMWRKGPGVKLFEMLEQVLGPVPILAEDLGVITPDVTALRKAGSPTPAAWQSRPLRTGWACGC